MKKIILSALVIVLGGTALLINGCKKDDTTAPVVTLNGASSRTVSLNGSLTDPGAKSDDGSAVTSDWSSTNPNFNTAGTYTITYSATDAAGNTGHATMTVIVKNDAAYLEGTYTCSEDGFATNWTQTITADPHYNNRIVFQYFGDYVTYPMSPQIYAQVTGSLVALPSSQNAVGGTSGCTHTFTPNGTATIPIALVSGKYNFSVKFTDQEQVGGSGCPGTGAIPTEDVCHQN